jgi:hypothetical protein
MLALYYTNTLRWICIVLAHWNNSPCVDIGPRSDTLSWFQTLKQQSVCRHWAPFGYIILIPNQPVFVLTPYCCVRNGEESNTRLIVFGLTRNGEESNTRLIVFGLTRNGEESNTVLIVFGLTRPRLSSWYTALEASKCLLGCWVFDWLIDWFYCA